MAKAPFRWDLVTPDQLGTLLDETEPPNLDFAALLAECSGRVLARSGNGDLAFVGRSLDSMFDLLSGSLSGVEGAPALYRVPLSFAREWRPGGPRRLNHDERDVARSVLKDAGITPHALARRSRPVTFVDVVHAGSTFTELYDLLREWIDDERAQWDVIRTKIRFIGVTSREKTSPNTWRWAQHRHWTDDLPGRSVLSVSLEPWVWRYFGNSQPKLTRSFAPKRWLADTEGPDRAEQTRNALAEAVAVVAYGRSQFGRRQIAAAISGEPALADAWLRTLRRRLAE